MTDKTTPAASGTTHTHNTNDGMVVHTHATPAASEPLTDEQWDRVRMEPDTVAALTHATPASDYEGRAAMSADRKRLLVESRAESGGLDDLAEALRIFDERNGTATLARGWYMAEADAIRARLAQDDHGA